MQKESSTGSVNSQRIRTKLCIRVEKIDFDVQASELHLAGPVIEENEHVKLGSYHTLDLELHRQFQLAKDEWDSIALQRIHDAVHASETAEIGAVVLQEGLANICFITENRTILRQRIDVNIPKKARGAGSGYEKGLEKFYGQVYTAMKQYFEFDKLKVVLLASPGFWAEGLREYILKEATREENKAIIQAKANIVTVHSSTGHVHALNEVLKSPEVLNKLSDTKFAKEVRALDLFYKTLGDDETKAFYGPKDVKEAIEKGAVGTLLISDSLFRYQKIKNN